ncbi:MAG: mannose-6-phosphate isomerase, class I [Actinomycetota bacterium]
MERLVATTQHYDWGDERFIAELQRRAASGLPEAELWMGAHPTAPAVLAGTGRSLDDVIAADPHVTLGDAVSRRFSGLPFLAKVLAADRPLSIQAHPSLAQARAGWERENRAGVPLDSPDRTYRDPNHKPELICALTPFEAKCGFRSLDATRELFDTLGGSGLAPVRERLAVDGPAASVFADTLAWLLRGRADRGPALAEAAVQAAADAPAGGPYGAELRWTAEIAQLHPGDVGVVVALLLNHVVLEPGQAVFLGAGNLHAYLRGAGIELMANSDNVVRGGLTSKHIDIEELLDVVDCTPIVPPVQQAVGCLHTFDAPVPEFSLTRVTVADDVRLNVQGPEILVVTEGIVEFVTQAGQQVAVEAGEPVWVPASDGCYLARGGGVFYRAAAGRL